MEAKVIGNVQGREIVLETGKIARQANGAVILRCGDTVLLATATMAKEPREGADFFPLMVDFVEKYYASGKIAGGYIKREARPSKNATLLSRLIDRPLRPCFPDNFFNEVQVVVNLLSYEEEFPIEHLSIIAASAALVVSDIPFNASVGAAVVGDVDGQLIVNPTYEEMDASDLDMVVAGTSDAVLMIESGASEISEERIIQAIEDGHAKGIKESIQLQEELAQKVGKEKQVFTPPEQNSELISKIDSFIGSKMFENLQKGNKQEVDDFLTALSEQVQDEFVDDDEENKGEVDSVYQSLKKQYIRESIIQQKVRPDGRKTDEIRDIRSEVDVLPATHGSSLFTRGETQSLGVITLGTDGAEQRADAFGNEISESFYVHYNFPPYSVGECGF